jgi:hypothetical protein
MAGDVRMKAAVWSEPDDVDAALARLGLAVAPLVVAVNRGHLAAISRTSNDAPNAAGFYQWNETLRTMREELSAFGFTRSDTGSYSTALRSDKRMAIAVSSGDEGTGIADANPSTRQGKGPRTIAVVSSNAIQFELFPGEIMTRPPAEDMDRLTWILLFRAAASELRAELSLPVTMNDGGQISAWRERIILPSQPLDTTLTIPEPDFGPELEIEIQRRT